MKVDAALSKREFRYEPKPRLSVTRVANGREQPANSNQAAAHFQITTRTLANWRKAGLPYWRINPRNYRYRLSDCENWLELRR
jgi:hypothetical protein